MATQKEIKQKIQSTKSINQITQAMQLVATAQSQRAIANLVKYKGYFLELQKIIKTLEHSLAQQKKPKYKGTY